ncbi:MAG: exodeoxyribonuclease VII large subunit [Spirochaetaceae bacterium]|jgi:exodeoxyribonuclease VII large subunit|nr:exodeoxyribonuclease VII large subunit [Spirochaetaceae bacterium]
MRGEQAAHEFTVTEITVQIKGMLENTFTGIAVKGEISNWRPSSSGHVYFTLKDENAALSGVMFKGSCRSLRFQPRDGMLVRAHGRISVFEPRGSYQIICDTLEQAGEGDILAMLEKRKRALAGEGLFNEDRKRSIPHFPERVAVVTSPTGAALRDILNVLTRRASGINVIVLPAPVQGADAAPIIAARIMQANYWKLADVLIVGRGGGSIEDLLPFSEECVVRAVAGSKIPVVSAVGHEIDWALCDYAADLRAPTPSAAAELVSENRGQALLGIRSVAASLYTSARARLENCRLQLKPFSTAEIERRFRGILQPYLVRMDDAKETLLGRFREKIVFTRSRLEKQQIALDAANPLAVLERGYSIVTNTRTGVVVKCKEDAQTADVLSIRPAAGIISAKVI